MSGQIKVEIDSRHPLFMSVKADDFGALFASMGDDDQVEVLRAMVKHMAPFPTQWDYISIQMERPENLALRRTLRELLFPDEASRIEDEEETAEALLHAEMVLSRSSNIATNDMGKGPNTSTQHALKLVRAALAKARGENPNG